MFSIRFNQVYHQQIEVNEFKCIISNLYQVSLEFKRDKCINEIIEAYLTYLEGSKCQNTQVI